MSFISSTLNKYSSYLLFDVGKASSIWGFVAQRFASKKAAGSTRNQRGCSRGRPKRRGLKVHDGQWVPAGSILVNQRTLRFFPGLNAGLGVNSNIFAIESGRVIVSCEKVDPDMTHTWIQRVYGGRDISNLHKKYVNIVTEPQHCRFKLVDAV